MSDLVLVGSSYPLVLVEWEDSAGAAASWQEIEGREEPEAVRIFSVGFLIFNGASRLTLAPHFGPDTNHTAAQTCGDMTIPASAVLRIVSLCEGDSVQRWEPKREECDG